MKSYLLNTLIVSIVLLAGCQLESPPKGTACPGMRYIQLDEGTRCYGIDDCRTHDLFTAENLHAIAMGFCPESFVCALLNDENGNASYCYYKNISGMVYCDGGYIDPLTNSTHCGAAGACNTEIRGDLNYVGDICGEDSYCHEGVCTRVSSCGEGTHQGHDGSCVPDTSKECGSERKNCEEDGKHCFNGECFEKCPNSTIECGRTSTDSSVCVYPNSNSVYCGAIQESPGICENYTTCTRYQTCLLGTCVQTSCPDDELLCGQGFDATCVSVNDDAKNCGKCGYVCADNPVNGAQSDQCKNASCVYICPENTENCGTDNQPNCVVLQNNSQHCGHCNHECNVNNGETCSNGGCIVNTCVNACLLDGRCENSDYNCGKSCLDCSTDVNAIGATCDAERGVCIISKCRENYHLSGEEGNYICVPNSLEECGKADSVLVDNCNEILEADVVVCHPRNGCMVQSCNENYHVYDNACEPNSPDHCGSYEKVCNVENADNFCNNTSCVFDCHDNFHRNRENTACVADTIDKCGFDEIDCARRVGGWNTGECTNGQCVVTGCAEGYHLYDNTCELDTIEHCGSHTRVCAVNNASNTCIQGDCQYSCNEGFRSTDGGCVSNTVTSCGPLGTDCSQTVEGWSEGSCLGDRCVAASCTSDYYVSAGTCVRNTDTNCRGLDCTAIANGTGTCQSGICRYSCDSNYHLTRSGNYCEENTVLNCGSTGYVCEEHVSNWLNGSCTENGICKVSQCKNDYHVWEAQNKCELNSNEACGLSREKCTTVDYSVYSCRGNGNDASCKVTGCKGYYYLSNGSCHAYDENNCGGYNKKCKNMMTGWKSGYCYNGKCVATECVPYDYKEVGGKCVTYCDLCDDYDDYSEQYCCDYHIQGCEDSGCHVRDFGTCLQQFLHDDHVSGYAHVFCDYCDDIIEDYDRYPEDFNYWDYLDYCYYHDYY